MFSSLLLTHLLRSQYLDCSQLAQKYDSSILTLIDEADGSAAKLVNMLAEDFDSFRDVHYFDGRSQPIRILKRAQILVADMWACFQGESYGNFYDIDKITMFADYRIPQILVSLGALYLSPSVASAIKGSKTIESGSSWEVQLRGMRCLSFCTIPMPGPVTNTPTATACSIWCVELIRREIVRHHPGTHVNAILIDFFLYDTIKELEAAGKEKFPHHRTRSIWY